MIHRKTEEEIG